MTNNHNDHNRGSNAVAFLIGAAVGGVTALLLAPESGAETRRRLAKGAKDVYHKGGDLAHDIKARARNKAELVTQTVKGAASEAKTAYREQLDRTRHEPDTDIGRARTTFPGQSSGGQS